jgi:ATP-binding cassette subfamily B protein/subfamily B ATP-binding cassette protein MsbA
LINGRDLRAYRLRAYRARLSIVQQETFLFDGTVRENIAYSRRNATDTEVTDAAKRAHAWEFIVKLPEGLDTIVGERGVKLSGGQRQRLSIARAILADPAILILDEATSNLDTHSEQLVQEAMNELFVGHTTFVVAHRLSTIQNADIIAVLEGGCIVQCGNHDQLMALGEGTTYYDMVMRQRTRDSFDSSGRAAAGA